MRYIVEKQRKKVCVGKSFFGWYKVYDYKNLYYVKDTQRVWGDGIIELPHNLRLVTEGHYVDLTQDFFSEDKDGIEKFCKELNTVNDAPKYRIFRDGNGEFWVCDKTSNMYGGKISPARANTEFLWEPSYIDNGCSENPYPIHYYKSRTIHKEGSVYGFKTLNDAEKAIQDEINSETRRKKATEMTCVK